ncbi:hypothetical protein [Nitrosospira briensis]|nr:hypothetical protein [Nitrosospira briensis]
MPTAEPDYVGNRTEAPAKTVGYYFLIFMEGYMKKLSRNMSDLNFAEFDNWIEPAMVKTFKHTKLGKNKLWGDTENSRNRNKKKREERIYS